MVDLDDRNTSHARYLYLRRQLGETQSSDMSMAAWSATWEAQRQVRIDSLLQRVADLQKNRDLSWENYKRQTLAIRNYNTQAEWEAAPLFIQAAIIKPSPSVRQDFFEGEVRDYAAPAAAQPRTGPDTWNAPDRPVGINDAW